MPDPASDRADDERIARHLERTWSAFFARFGRLTPVQRAAIPTILDGRDVLVTAATASGKTEAACAPLIERQMSSRAPWTILYVSPTRALVNDLYERLYRPLHQLGLRVERRTGEYRPSPGQLPHVLLTTPESFDSMLCRGRRQNDRIGHDLAGVSAIVLDEIHLLHGTPRGEQVRWLFDRLRRLRSEAKTKGWVPFDGVQTVALSATLPDAHAVSRAYLQEGETIVVPGGREIEEVVPPSLETSIEVALPAYVEALQRPEKILVFCNARKRVDLLTAYLRGQLASFGYEIAAHHGSLDKTEREATEGVIKQEQKSIVVATSTLEIGIDIGDVDLVVLDGPAPDISALLQRIGRGNRRSNKTRVMNCADNPFERLVLEAMMDSARAGWLGLPETGPQFAVARQQVASYIFQAEKRSRARSRVQGFLDDNADPVVARNLVDRMIRDEELKEDASGIRLGAEWIECSSRGEIHSNIEGRPGTTVTDERTGRAIASGVRDQFGRGLQVGGHLLEVRRRSDFRLEVQRVASEERASGEWSYVTQSQLVSAGQAQAVRRYLGLTGSDWPIIHDRGSSFIFHFGGARRRAVIELAAQYANSREKKVQANHWFLRVPGVVTQLPGWMLDIGSASLELTMASSLDRLERTLARPRANARLPIEARLEEVRAWLQLESEVVGFRSARCEVVQISTLREQLLSIVADHE